MKVLKLIVIFLIFQLPAEAQFGLPSFKNVVSTFFSKYSFISNETYLKFSRKKDGWYVCQDSFTNPGNFTHTELFWSEKLLKFRELNYPLSSADTNEVSENVNKYLQMIAWDYDEYQFQRIKYFGYPGWDWDVINEDIELNKMNDTLLESKGRANSNYASGFITEQFGDVFINDDSNRIPLKATEKISKPRINEFIFYELAAIDAYNKLIDRNPGYMTKVGDVAIKRANEYMFMYIDLAMAGDSLNALKFAGRAHYSDSIIKQSKSYFESLPLNCILITNGDNDTYPLWFLQKTQNYRQDVIVLNYSLLGFRRYLSFIDKTFSHSLFTTSAPTYLKNNFDYFLYSNPQNENKNIGVSEFLTELIDGFNPYDTTTNYYKDEVLKKYYSKNLFFRTKGNRKSAVLQIHDYLYMNEYILLDIINTTKKRKIFFTFKNDLISNLLAEFGNVYEVKL